MRKLFVSNLVSLDGFFEGPNADLNWFVWDDDLNAYSREMMQEVGLMVFGRKTHDLMAAYWPTASVDPQGNVEDTVIKKLMNGLPKVVFSRSLKSSDWNNTTVTNRDAVAEVRKLKEQPGKDMAIFGSVNLLASLLPAGLVDEYRVILNPVAIGQGTPLFNGINEEINFRLLGTRALGSGVVILAYQPQL